MVPPTPRVAAPATPPTVLETPPTVLPSVEVTNLAAPVTPLSESSDQVLLGILVGCGLVLAWFGFGLGFGGEVGMYVKYYGAQTGGCRLIYLVGRLLVNISPLTSSAHDNWKRAVRRANNSRDSKYSSEVICRAMNP
ncbi:hypothetical protein BJX66DRAFT_244460 [Aspergillus keveii]|uniref:Uncharacterized protein n=1 Tax=Aspergillus keveii TaxID=714993 RepID=A0ABR4GKP9_9EURO